MTVYRVVGYAIAALVIVQAASMAYAIAGLTTWVQEGGTLDKAAMESRDLSFTGVGGFIVHGINGMMVIPVLTLLLLIISFFAKVPGGVKWALYTVAAVVVQVALGLFGHGLPLLGLLHGGNALILFSVAFMAAHRVRKVAPQASRRAEESVAVPG